MRKPVITSSKISSAPSRCVIFAQPLEKPCGWRHDAHVGSNRLDDHGGNFSGMLLKHALDRFEIVVRRIQSERRKRAGHARAGRDAERCKAGARLDEKAIGVAVIAAFEFQDQVALGEAAGGANRRHRRFGAGADEPNALDRGKRSGDVLAELDFERRSHPIAGAAPRLFGDGGDHVGMRVAQNQRAPGAHVVDVFAAVDVPEARAPGAIDHEGRAAHGAKSAHRAVHAADKNVPGAFKQLRRARGDAGSLDYRGRMRIFVRHFEKRAIPIKADVEDTAGRTLCATTESGVVQAV